MSNTHGDFIWYELMTDDPDAAQTFYGKLLGWTFRDSGQPNMDYRTISAKTENIGGMLPLDGEMIESGAQPWWFGYIAVDDVDKSAHAIEKAGGKIHLPPFDIPDVGRVSYVSDPHGALFYIMNPTPPADRPNTTSTAFSPTEMKDGHCVWNELATSQQDRAIDFYTEQFGWTQTEEMDMGPMGIYKLLHHGATMIAGILPKPHDMPVASWTFYFHVPDIDAAIETVKANGGQVTQEPVEIPGGEFSMSGIDPQGAMFSLAGPRK